MMSMEQDHYGVLELEPGSPMEDVKSQYRRLAKRDHPDLHGNDARSQEQFRRVNAAYTFLSDAQRKAAYDAVLLAARRAGAPALKVATSPKPAPAPPRPGPPPMARGYHRGVTTAGFREQPRDDVRMTRSAWLGATAGAILVVLVIGLSLNGSGPSRPAAAGGMSSVPPGSASGNALDDRSETGGGSEPSADTDPLMSSPGVPSDTASTDTAPSPIPRVSPGIAPPATPMRAGDAWMPPSAMSASPAEMDPSGVLTRRLLARSRVVLPRTDRLLGRGYAIRTTGLEADDGSRRILREQLAADLADLSAVRARLRPDLARLSRQDTPEEARQEAGLILADLDRMEDAGKPVSDDIKALTAVPAAPGPLRAAVHLSSSAFRLSPNTFRLSPPVPTRAASNVSPPAVPMPAVAATVLPKPKPSEQPAPNPPAKPKAQAPASQEFIMWGK